VKIIAKGKLAVILLLDSADKTFAICPVTDDAAVERTLDSGRYFVLRIQNAQKQKAFIGIAFNERNDAFDFNVALSDFKSECERDDMASRGELEGPKGPARDFSLKEGEKIKINIGGGSTKKEKPMYVPKVLPPPGSKSGLLAPPPSDAANFPASSSSSLSSSSSSDFSGFDSSFGDLTLSNKTTAVAEANICVSVSDPFGSGDPFGTTDPFASTVFTTPPQTKSATNSDFPW